LGLGRPPSHQIGREGAGGGFQAEIQEMGRRAAGVREGDEKMKWVRVWNLAYIPLRYWAFSLMG
jgi:hypothetical protein